ncbi:uncharacterized protein [Pleurodeles waltl]|uniref:uncharacterized protein n=1 Tax=Pleurodeles waltl TaxID=8319 RepID=UPI0037096C92
MGNGESVSMKTTPLFFSTLDQFGHQPPRREGLNCVRRGSSGPAAPTTSAGASGSTSAPGMAAVRGGGPAAARTGIATPAGHPTCQEIASWLRWQRLEGIHNEYRWLVALQEDEDMARAVVNMPAGPSSSNQPSSTSILPAAPLVQPPAGMCPSSLYHCCPPQGRTTTSNTASCNTLRAWTTGWHTLRQPCMVSRPAWRTPSSDPF